MLRVMRPLQTVGCALLVSLLQPCLCGQEEATEEYQQLLDAGLDQTLRFVEHIADRAAGQLAAHRRNDAEAA